MAKCTSMGCHNAVLSRADFVHGGEVHAEIWWRTYWEQQETMQMAQKSLESCRILQIYAKFWPTSTCPSASLFFRRTLTVSAAHCFCGLRWPAASVLSLGEGSVPGVTRPPTAWTFGLNLGGMICCHIKPCSQSINRQELGLFPAWFSKIFTTFYTIYIYMYTSKVIFSQTCDFNFTNVKISPAHWIIPAQRVFDPSHMIDGGAWSPLGLSEWRGMSINLPTMLWSIGCSKNLVPIREYPQGWTELSTLGRDCQLNLALTVPSGNLKWHQHTHTQIRLWW